MKTKKKAKKKLIGRVLWGEYSPIMRQLCLRKTMTWKWWIDIVVDFLLNIVDYITK